MSLTLLKAEVKVPFAGYRSYWEPTWLVRLRFVRDGPSIIRQGYHQFKDSLFQVRRIGADIVILTPKYVDEIRALSQDKVRSVEPFIHDFIGDYTRGTVFLESDLQNRVIQQRLTPNLGLLTSIMKTELDLALKKEIPECKDQWFQVDINHLLARTVAHISSRVFLGPEECRNEEWHTATAEYSKNLFITGMALRMLPRWLRPVVAPLMPSYRALLTNVATSRKIIGGILNSRQASKKELGPNYAKPTDILQWMMDEATGRERSLDNLAQRMLILSLTSIHTTALTMTQALYDLCAHPEYFEPLRTEAANALFDVGRWDKTLLSRLYKLDSLLKESQRFSPVFLLTFNRIFHNPMTLSDGTFLPPGTRVAVPSNAILQDPGLVPGPAAPSKFDPFRYSKLREDPAQAEKAHRFMFTMTNSSNMAFGYGRYACPGRFYAANEMKLILSHLLLRYEFNFPAGAKRPANFTIDSDMFPDPAARLLIRERKSLDPFLWKLTG
ncbi:cytochrome p450 [Hirsutella rhossiliensis]|uniref:Cytochrome p450 domain-containing protein n=1 Tax=Hirsutella rhossiliensis TaxID=111463 RepID=A0A9P8SF23_9HYPO|nr:cytochrome p450 domain-containing protein [Hirsutella rhossiliensis]KAH0960438.1 cytochrome p450 domain-containing protein [Hirsutella rhossiliensis]